MKRIWNCWKIIAQSIGNIQFELLFSIFYLSIIPLGIMVRIAKDSLAKAGKPEWMKIKDNTSSLEKMRMQ